jgi:hypothetical protein
MPGIIIPNTLMMNASTPAPFSLIYYKGELASEVFAFQSEEQAKDYQARNPPDLLVQSIYLDSVDGSRQVTYNPFFSEAVYAYALKEKRWEDGYYVRTGQQWKDRCDKQPGDEDLDHDACLRLFGLHQGFTEKELGAAYREAIKMNHPDKVASMAEEFRLLVEKRAKLINQAYSKLLGKA